MFGPIVPVLVFVRNMVSFCTFKYTLGELETSNKMELFNVEIKSTMKFIALSSFIIAFGINVYILKR